MGLLAAEKHSFVKQIVSIIREQMSPVPCSRIIEQLIENKNVKLKITQRALLLNVGGSSHGVVYFSLFA
jgi:hypothetical protein